MERALPTFTKNLPDNNNPLRNWQYPFLYCLQSRGLDGEFHSCCSVLPKKTSPGCLFLWQGRLWEPRLRSVSQGMASRRSSVHTAVKIKGKGLRSIWGGHVKIVSAPDSLACSLEVCVAVRKLDGRLPQRVLPLLPSAFSMKRNFPIISANVTEAKSRFQSVCWHEAQSTVACLSAPCQATCEGPVHFSRKETLQLFRSQMPSRSSLQVGSMGSTVDNVQPCVEVSISCSLFCARKLCLPSHV